MKPQTTTRRKAFLFLLLLLLSVNVCEARVSVGIGIGFPAYGPAPEYYGPPPGYYYDPEPGPYYEPAEYYGPVTDVEWVPRHLEDGYWVPGQYVNYVTTAPGPDYGWVQGHWVNHHWRHGYWHHY